MRDRRPRLVYFVNCFPNFIEAMIYREVMALRRAGWDVETISIRRPSPEDVPAEARALAESTTYILPVRPGKLLAAHARAFLRTPRTYLRTLGAVVGGTHERLRDRWRSLCHFVEAVAVLPIVEGRAPDRLHAHWAVGATTCAMVVSRFLKIPFSFTAHAYDIWRERLLLPEKLRAAEHVVTCTGYNRRHLVEAYGVPPEKVSVVYHGLDLAAFRRRRRPHNARPVILSVGRLVEQKGYEDLIRACALLRDEGCDLECEIVGEGPLRERLQSLVVEMRLEAIVRLPGRVVGDALRAHYERADVFALLCVQASDGDRDGIPNTLVEAMAMELPVVSTRYSGVPELVEDGVTGLLVEPGDVPAAAAALRTLLESPARRESMGRAGRARVMGDFTPEATTTRLGRVFAEPEAAPLAGPRAILGAAR